MDSCIPVEMEENALQPVDDTLELDVLDSDVEVTDTSAVTVILASTEDRSPLQTSPVVSAPLENVVQETDGILNKAPSDSECVSTKTTRHRRSSGASASEPVSDSSKTEEHSHKRRRKWGSTIQEKITVEHLNDTASTENVVHASSTDELVAHPSSVADHNITETGMQATRPTTDVNNKPPSTKPRGVEKKLIPVVTVDASERKVDDFSRANQTSKLSASHRETSGPSSSSQPKDRESSKPDRTSRKRESTTGSQNLSSSAPSKRHSPSRRKGPKETKGVGYLVEPPERVEPSQPAHYRPTDIVYIRSLVRPFTADQLRQMITDHYGPVVDLWLDRIKSTSLVRLESIEAAKRCREGLDGSRWPSMNPRTLHCDFGNEAVFAWMKEHGNTGDALPPRHMFASASDRASPEIQNSSKKSKPSAAPEHSISDRRETKSSSSLHKSGRRAPSTGDVADSSKVPEPNPTGDVKKKDDEPAKLLDDLFRKTTATPCIYWLPLTPQQAEKQSVERVRLLAEKRSALDQSNRSLSSTGPAQRATRSPFTSPGRMDSASIEGTRAASSRAAFDRSSADRCKTAGGAGSGAVTDKRDSDPNDLKRKPQKSCEFTENARNKSKSPVEVKRGRDKIDGTGGSLRKREQSPFTPERSQPNLSERGPDKPRFNAQAANTKRNRSRSSSHRKSRVSRNDRPVRSRRSPSNRSRSSTGPRRKSFATSGDVRPSYSSRYGRPRSRSVERRAISPPMARTHDRSRR